jgi:hypothetical protein
MPRQPRRRQDSGGESRTMVAQASPLMRLRSNLMAGRDSCSLLSSVFGHAKTWLLTTSEAVMRDEAIVLLAAASSIMFSVASVARAEPDLQQHLESTSPASDMVMTAQHHPAPHSKYLELLESAEKFTVTAQCCSSASPRMIIWSVCGAPTSGSALSMYSGKQKPARSLQGSATLQDVPSHQCADEDEEGRDEDSTGGK